MSGRRRVRRREGRKGRGPGRADGPDENPVRRPRPGWPLVKIALRLALILMTLSLFLCRDVSSPQGLANVPLGLPIPFVVLDASAHPEGPFPRCIRFADPKRHPMRLEPLAALADLVLLTGGLILGAGAVGRGWTSGAGS